MYHLQTARLFVVDNAYLPIHVAPHRRATTVVQVWHAVGALKRFGLDTPTPLGRAGADASCTATTTAVVVGGERARGAVRGRASGRRSSGSLALGSPRTDFFFDEAAMAAARGARPGRAIPALAGRRVVLYAPTFRGRGHRQAGGARARRRRACGRPCRPTTLLVLKTHPNLDPGRDPDRRLRPRRRPDGRDQRPARR